MKYFNKWLIAIFSMLITVIILLLSMLGISIAILTSMNNNKKIGIDEANLIESEGFITINDQRRTKENSSIEYDLKIQNVNRIHRKGIVIEGQANSIMNNISSSNLTGNYSGTFVFDQNFNYLPFEEDNDFQNINSLWNLKIDPLENEIFFTKNPNRYEWTLFEFGTWSIETDGVVIGDDDTPMNEWPTEFRFKSEATLIENFGPEGSTDISNKWVNIEFRRNWFFDDEPPFRFYADANDDDSQEYVDYDNPDFYFDGFGNLSINGKSLKTNKIWSEMDNSFYFETNQGSLPILNENFWFGSDYFHVDLNKDDQADHTVYLKSNKYEDKSEYYRLFEFYIL